MMANSNVSSAAASHADIWQAALGELETCMPKGYFDALLKPAFVLESENGTFRVAVKNENLKNLIEQRLRPAIEHVLSSVMEREVRVEFVAIGENNPVEAQELKPDWNILHLDTSIYGWTSISNYEIRFWAPLLGPTAWALYLRIRSDCEQPTEAMIMTPKRRYVASSLAQGVSCGTQAIIGTWRTCKSNIEGAVRCDEDGLVHLGQIYPDLRAADLLPPVDGKYRRRQVGALRRLAAEDMAQYERVGKEPHVFYTASVRVKPLLLYPEQVSRLPAALVSEHDQWILDNMDIDSGTFEF